jgi:hypothetical protein
MHARLLNTGYSSSRSPVLPACIVRQGYWLWPIQVGHGFGRGAKAAPSRVMGKALRLQRIVAQEVQPLTLQLQ